MGSSSDPQPRPSTRPKQTTKSTATQQQNRKRVQNRTSQQCLRERQQAHTRHLESLVELMMTAQQDGDSPEKQNQSLMASNLKLIEQNRQLQDALFRMKKKLLGLSNLATAAANDEVFEQLLGTESNKKINPQSGSPSNGEAHCVSSGQENHDSNSEIKAATPSLSVDLVTTIEGPGEPSQLFETLSPSQGATTVSTSLATPPGGPSHSLPPAPQITGTFKPVPMLMLERILDVCSVYLWPTGDTGSTIPPDWCDRGSLGGEASRVALVERLREAVVHTLASWAGLEAYLYGIGVFAPMERIVQWRLTRSLEDRLVIPEPFRPTPLQLNSKYPICIDFLNWASIRDQLILHRDRCDLMVLTHDIVMNTVVDLPSWSASVNIYDIFYNKILPGSLIPEGLFSPPKGAGEDNANYLSESLTATDPDLAEQLIRRDLSQRLTHGLYPLSEEDMWQSLLCEVSLRTRPRFARPPLIRLAGCYGVDQVTRWKLSPAFARKYPFLDCLDVTANFEMISCSDLPGL